MPRSAAISSAATSMPNDRPKPTRRPVAMSGSAAGSATLTQQRRPVDVHGLRGAQQHRRDRVMPR